MCKTSILFVYLPSVVSIYVIFIKKKKKKEKKKKKIVHTQHITYSEKAGNQ